MQSLQPFVGEWKVQFSIPTLGDVTGRVSFEWAFDGRFLIERSEVDDPQAPDALMVIAPAADGDGFTQHYFDSRGVVRLYAMTFDGRIWTLERHEADFSPLPFRQRFVGTFSEDGDRIDCHWDKTNDADEFERDFDGVYTRVGSG